MQKGFLFILLTFFSIGLIAQNKTVQPVFQTGHDAKVNGIKFHPNNQYLVSCGDDGKVIIWDVQLGLQRKSIIADESGVKMFQFLTDSLILTLGQQGDVKMWSFPELNFKKSIAIDGAEINALAIVNDSTLFFAGKGLYLYDLKGKHSKELNYQSKGVFTALAYQPSRKEIAVAGPIDNYCTTIHLSDAPVYKQFILGNINKTVFVDSVTLLLSNTEGALQIINVADNKKETFTLLDDLNFVTGMDKKGNDIAVSTAFGFITVFDAQNQDVKTKIGLNGISLTDLDYSNDGQWLATANTEGTVYLYDAEGYKLNKILKGASASVLDVQVFGNHMLVGYSNGIIRHIHLPTNKIQSNSVKLDVYQQQNGVNYAILSIDGFVNNQVEFTVLKTSRHHKESSLLRAAEKIKSVWDLKSNTLVLEKSVDDLVLKTKVHRNFVGEIPFQFWQYTEKSNKLELDAVAYEISEKGLSFHQIIKKDTLFFPIKHTAPITGLRYLSDYQIIVSFSKDGSIRFWDEKANYLAELHLSGQYSFVYWNNDDHYFASKEMLDKIGFIYKNKLYSFEQYDIYYNRPDEVMKKLPFFLKKEVADYRKAYFKRLEKLGMTSNELNIEEVLPIIELTYLDEYSTKKEQVTFEVSMLDSLENIVSFAYLINGIENQFTVTKPQKQIKKMVTIKLGAGINQIEFYCTNAKGVKSLIRKKNITCEKSFDKPNLYLVSVGVSYYLDSAYNLSYADKDAREIALILEKSKKYSKIYRKTILNQDFTKKCQNEVEAFVSQAKMNDVIVFFYAGHGLLDKSFDYYLGTYDIDFSHPEINGIEFDEMEQFFEALECRNKLILIDACFSGELDKTTVKVKEEDTESGKDIRFRGSAPKLDDGGGEMGIFELSKRTFADLRKSRGTNILSSASGIEYALEGDKWGNGVFTYALKKGLMDGDADLNGDNRIRIMELQVYLRETVSLLSKGKQNPVLRKENIKNNFVIW